MSNAPDWDGAEVEITAALRVKYKVNAESYPDSDTLEEAMAIDLKNFEHDPFLYADEIKTEDLTWRRV